MSSSEASNRAPLKHRACDECRSRKLACSKEPTGCSRCVCERINCVYSPQKQMGRPRKRQAVEELVPEPNVVQDNDTQPIDNDTLLNEPYANFNSLPFPLDGPSQSAKSMSPAFQQAHGLYTLTGDGRAVYHFGSELINNPPDFGSVFDTEESPDSYDSSAPAPLPSITPLSLEPSPKPEPACSCLASMYLAMASLQELPTDISKALTTVRSALYAAQDVIRCDKCGTVVVTHAVPSIEAFQNTMLLGTILPTIVDSYRRLLTMVDEETNRVQSLGVKKLFRLSDYGGIFDIGGLCCETMAQYENTEMDPVAWRSTVRALLRTDIYGHPEVTAGLVGVISEMEQRQRNRHANLEIMFEVGLWQPDFNSHCYQDREINPTPQCLQILNMAKDAVNSLVIA